MTADDDKTKPAAVEFDFSAYPSDTLFHDRRGGRPRRDSGPEKSGHEAETAASHRPVRERRARAERRKRVDPTTFEKQYTDDELEFMNAMQRFKERTGKPFPTHGEVIRVAVALGYRKLVDVDPACPLDESDRAQR
jgi:hypothetical protein